MKTIKSVLTVLAVMLTGVLVAQNYTVDVAKSSLAWKGKKIGGEHYGNIALKSGSFTVANNKIKSGTFVIDMTSITCTDIDDKKYNAKLVGHLKSDDFFGVANYPEAKLVVTESGSFTDGKASVKGKLSIKGKTEPISFTVKQSGDSYTADIAVDRTKYDVRYGSKTFFDNLGDKVIDDTFTLQVKLHTTK